MSSDQSVGVGDEVCHASDEGRLTLWNVHGEVVGTTLHNGQLDHCYVSQSIAFLRNPPPWFFRKVKCGFPEC